ncbi:MAG: tetratricopeptide repeat protein, partial [Winogradskyella sp.]|uniref:tetratricopeptide repeat protein n=1 Tax=Winogradskyella sp. TaxID=1883156 RepID=UPI0017CE48F2|nr:tetratricopeptide repeat protein [Winogradskyella sp.]
MRVTIFLLIWCFGCFGFSQSNTVFEEANSLYNDGKFAEAIDKYESILDSNFHSAELYFNLANANYKLNNVASSIYYYEKALQLDPHDDDIKNNLSYAQNMTIDAIDRVPQVGFSRIVNNLIKLMSADAWATTGICGVVLFVLLFIMYHFSYATTKKRLSFIFSIIGLLIGCFALLMAFQKERIDKRDNPAIVFAQE